MTKKKDAEAKSIAELKALPLEQLVLDKAKEKYLLVPLAAEWAKELKKSEEFRHMTQNEILDKSLEDVISGAITWEKLEKAQKESNGAAEAEAEAEAPKKKKEQED